MHGKEGNLREVFRLDGGGWFRVAGAAGSEKLRAEPSDALELDLAPLWTW